jgi:hypothetical protein
VCCAAIEEHLLNATVASIKLNTYVDSGQCQFQLGCRILDSAIAMPAALSFVGCWWWHILERAHCAKLRLLFHCGGFVTVQFVPQSRYMLLVCAAGEFLGSLVQIEEGLRKLNINEEVGG